MQSSIIFPLSSHGIPLTLYLQFIIKYSTKSQIIQILSLSIQLYPTFNLSIAPVVNYPFVPDLTPEQQTSTKVYRKCLIHSRSLRLTNQLNHSLLCEVTKFQIRYFFILREDNLSCFVDCSHNVEETSCVVTGPINFTFYLFILFSIALTHCVILCPQSHFTCPIGLRQQPMPNDVISKLRYRNITEAIVSGEVVPQNEDRGVMLTVYPVIPFLQLGNQLIAFLSYLLVLEVGKLNPSIYRQHDLFLFFNLGVYYSLLQEIHRFLKGKLFLLRKNAFNNLFFCLGQGFSLSVGLLLHRGKNCIGKDQIFIYDWNPPILDWIWPIKHSWIQEIRGIHLWTQILKNSCFVHKNNRIKRELHLIIHESLSKDQPMQV